MSDAEQPEIVTEPPSGSEAEEKPRVRVRINPVRVFIWLVLLGSAVGLWVYVKQNPDLQEQISAFIGQKVLPQEQALAKGSAGQFDAEQEAREELTKRGALVIAEPGSRAVSSVNFPDKDVDDETLALLEPLYRLTSLNLGGANMSDEQMKHLAGLSSLASLVLSNTPITDDGLAHLDKLRQLEVIHLRNTAVSDTGLAHLGALTEMKIIDISRTKVTDEGLRHLTGLKKLSWLLIQDLPITDAGLEHLHELKNLKELTLTGTDATPDGIAAIRKAIPGLAIDQ
jgi:hypothetical protein